MLYTTLPIAIGQYRALRLAFQENPELTIVVILLLIGIAFYFKSRK